MGAFDNARCKYPLPWPEAADFGEQWQTKSPDAPWGELWEIREDGTLWHQDCEYEDRSDPNAEGFTRLLGSMTPVNHRWQHMAYWNGEFEIHHYIDPPDKPSVWYSVVFWVRDGVVKDAICAKDVREPGVTLPPTKE